MNFAFPAFLLSLFLLPGFVLANKILILDGNSSTDRPFSLGLIFSIITAPLIHSSSILVVNWMDLTPNIVENLDVYFNIILQNTNNAILPSFFQFSGYMVLTIFLSIVYALGFNQIRKHLLFYSIKTENVSLYQFTKYSSDWFNFFNGWSDLEPKSYFLSNDVIKTIVKRDVSIIIAYEEVNKLVTYIGAVVDFTPSSNGELYSVVVDVIETTINGESHLLDKPQRKMFFTKNIINLETNIFDFSKTDLDKLKFPEN
ncbi:MAG: hypothetical protein L3J83_10875 [Proteobacteria bacterium]|nr:hypothetical protein [Pseudomonadota bacterium]